MKKKTILRNATTEDIDAIADVYLRSRTQLVAFVPFIHSLESLQEWVRNALLPKEHVIVAEEKGVIIGMMSLTKDHGIGWIKQLYIHPEAVGHGIGTLMLIKAKSILGSPIHLFTFEKNTGARRFYERHGFKAIDVSSDNEEKRPAVLYEWIA